ncbi:helix-turn-helix transcriptional regulator [Micromonospora aurantiaca]|uniref:helix-turn-helix domain-containing protein n=1 Tax=Micromonospora aurantiaca (nom. illeg.) TaxID=47850 RepID=UPI0033D3E416
MGYIFGRQPARQLIRESGMTITGAARLLGLHQRHLAAALRGQIRPSHEVRVALTDFFGVPITELFTPEVIEVPHRLQKTGCEVTAR